MTISPVTQFRPETAAESEPCESLADGSHTAMNGIAILIQRCPQAKDIWENSLPDYLLLDKQIVQCNHALLIEELQSFFAVKQHWDPSRDVDFPWAVIKT